ncbi:MAG: Hint domain-containing protein [Verrucomicrobiota bacterium]
MLFPRHLLAALVAAALPMLLGGCALFNLAANTALTTTAIATQTAMSALPIKLAFKCIPEGTLIDTPNGRTPIEELNPGDTVIGFAGNPVSVIERHTYDEDPTSKRFMTLTFANGAKVDLCDMHRIDGVHAMDIAVGETVGGQTLAEIETYDGVHRSYDLLTGDAGYRIDGIPVNSMIEELNNAAYQMWLHGEPQQ